MPTTSDNNRSTFLNIILFAAFGYFVDMYGILLPMMLPIESFKPFGDPEVVKNTLMLWQMGGIILGGFVWGIIGDLYGRINALFYAVLFYMIGSIWCSFINDDLEMYKLARFVMGIGLAGELGAITTLACEILPTRRRAEGIAVITGVGFLGGLFAYFITHNTLFTEGSSDDIWHNAYKYGGIMGFSIAFLRFFLKESPLYIQLKPSQKSFKNLFRVWGNRRTLILYLCALLIGLPIWFRIGILVGEIPKLSELLKISDTTHLLKPDFVAFCMYSGVVLGNFACPILSDFWKSRKNATLVFLTISCLSVVWLLLGQGATAEMVLFKFFVMGIGTGYWGTFVMMSAEVFGTNVRCAVTTTTPNLIRGSLIPMLYIVHHVASERFLECVDWLAAVCFAVAFIAWWFMEETYGRDLDFVETFEK